MKRIAHYVERYPARLAGYISAIILNVSHLIPAFPIGLFIPTAMLLIMIGEGSQRMEDEKTVRALYTGNDPEKPDAEILLAIAESASKGRK